MTTHWHVPTKTPQREKEIAALQRAQQGSYGFSRPMIAYLYNQGVREVAGITKLMDVTIADEENPHDLTDIHKAVAAIVPHIKSKKPIIVFGDYDCDGVCSTSIMVRALRHLGANVDYFVNDRFKHGYGIKKSAVEAMVKEKGKPSLIITVDNGITGFEGITYAQSQGMEVVVTDHHLPSADLPRATAVVNPHRLDDASKFKDICGATVAYKTMLALYFHMEEPFDYLYGMRDLVALATVGDVMPLIKENRWFVKEGLRLIGNGTRKQFHVLQEVKQGKKPFELNADLFGFTLSPIMNAPGRLLGKPNLAIDFFLTDDVATMTDLAHQLIDLNERRKALTTEQVAIVEATVSDTDNVLVVYHPDLHEGIIGLVAGQLKEKYGKPAIVLGQADDGTLKGSARSIGAYHLREALDRMASHLLTYGGHAMAAGLSLEEGALPAFKAAIVKDAASLTAADLQPEVNVDAVLAPHELTEELVLDMERLQPFGVGFPKPNFGLGTLEVSKVFYMTDGKHAKMVGKNGLNVLMFGGGDFVRSLGDFSIIQAVGSPSINRFRGKTDVQFMVNRGCLVGK